MDLESSVRTVDLISLVSSWEDGAGKELKNSRGGPYLLRGFWSGLRSRGYLTCCVWYARKHYAVYSVVPGTGSSVDARKTGCYP